MLSVGDGETIELELLEGAQERPVEPGAEARWRGLTDEDVRKSLDEAVRRGWTEIARRLVRIVALAFVDVLTSALAWSASLFLLAHPDQIQGAGTHIVSAVLMQPIILAACGAYQAGRGRADPGRIIRGVLLGTAVVWIKAAFFGLPLSGWVFGAYALTASFLVVGARLLVDALVARARQSGVGTQRLIVIGTERETLSLREALARTDGNDLELVGRLSPGRTYEPGSVAGRSRNLAPLTRAALIAVPGAPD